MIRELMDYGAGFETCIDTFDIIAEIDACTDKSHILVENVDGLFFEIDRESWDRLKAESNWTQEA